MTRERAMRVLELTGCSLSAEAVEKAVYRLKKRLDPSKFMEPNSKADAETKLGEVVQAAEFLLRPAERPPTEADPSVPDDDSATGGDSSGLPVAHALSPFDETEKFVLDFIEKFV